MKKIFAMLLALTMLLAFTACGTPAEPTAAPTTEATQAPTTEATQAPTTEATEAPTTEATQAPTTEATEAPTTEPAVIVMTHEEFVAAELDTPVVIETYVQATESWWDGKIQVYAQSEDGGYYIYDLACTEEEAAAFVPGTKIRVSGYKAEWSGEVEIIDATYEIIEGSFIAEATDVTALLGTDELAAHMNELVSMNGLTVAPSTDADGNEVAFLYKWDGSGEHGSDLYFNVSVGDQVFTFTVNVYMLGTGADSEVYAAIEGLEIGDVINLEGFLYWYNAPQPHITAVEVVE